MTTRAGVVASFNLDSKQTTAFYAATLVRRGASAVPVFSKVDVAESQAEDDVALGLDVQDNGAKGDRAARSIFACSSNALRSSSRRSRDLTHRLRSICSCCRTLLRCSISSLRRSSLFGDNYYSALATIRIPAEIALFISTAYPLCWSGTSIEDSWRSPIDSWTRSTPESRCGGPGDRWRRPSSWRP